MYASWSFVMFLITLAVTLVYELNMSEFNVHLIITGLLLVKIVIYFLIENYAVYSYCKFVFTPWLVYGLFLLDLLVNPPVNSSGSSGSFNLFPTRGNYWNYQVNNLSSLLKIDYLVEISLVSVFVFLFIVKVLKFVSNEFCQKKVFLHSF